MLIVQLLTLLLAPFHASSTEYVNSEYLIPKNETPGIINNACEEDYIPVHSRELLKRVENWAVGAIFFNYAREADFHFNQARYLGDNPHQGLFNFGFATARTCLEIDVIGKALSLNVYMRALLAKVQELDQAEAKQVFSQTYLDLAIELSFDQYLSKVSEELAQF